MVGIYCCQVNLIQAESTEIDSLDINNTAFTVVDQNLVRFAALEYADKFYRESYKEFYVYDETTYYDLEDQPDVYAVTLCSDVNDIPDLNELKVTIQDKYNDIKRMEDSIAVIENEPLSGKAKAELMSNLRKQIKTIQKQLRQEDRFVTILCGATEEHVPVLRAHKGLPEHLTLLPNLQEILSSDPELSDYQPDRIHYLGLFDLGYALKKGNKENSKKAADGNSLDTIEQKVVSIKNKKVRTKTEMLNKRDVRKAERASAEEQQPLEMQVAANERLEEREARIKEKWTKIKQLHEKKVLEESNQILLHGKTSTLLIKQDNEIADKKAAVADGKIKINREN